MKRTLTVFIAVFFLAGAATIATPRQASAEPISIILGLTAAGSAVYNYFQHKENKALKAQVKNAHNTVSRITAAVAKHHGAAAAQAIVKEAVLAKHRGKSKSVASTTDNIISVALTSNASSTFKELVDGRRNGGGVVVASSASKPSSNGVVAVAFQ